MRPGKTIWPDASIVSRPRNCLAIAAAVSTASDVRAVDRDGAVLDDAARGIDRDDGTSGHDQINVPRRILSRQSNHRDEGDGGHGGEPGAHRAILVVFQPCPFT